METSWVSVLLVMVLLALTYCTRNPLTPTRSRPSQSRRSRKERTPTPEAGAVRGLGGQNRPGAFLEAEAPSNRFHLDR
ncbi:hypothetical protein [Meiothermus sp. Pnk-1]|uniref:hypothetical protein n=1 Tax=Meiothermus sp. Pnk-1 TaxID=873128 RepID=UPI000D7C6090|nr:hypothetical protein [Meiothermus sp. Pnk-1]PZA06374.1 hypothetical protein DNA98_13420 [Meiothermus sp. Pnk-1]